MNHSSIKETAKELGLRVNDLLVLARQNDPFYVGTPSQREAAAWFAEHWQKFGFVEGVHLRRIHYRLISQEEPVLMPNGKRYENTEGCWKFLNDASKWARYLNLVDAGAFVDRRNPAPVICTDYDSDPTPGREVDAWTWPAVPSVPRLPELSALPRAVVDWPALSATGYDSVRQYHVEVWCEKTTMNDILEPLCKQLGVNLVTGAGELSYTATHQFLQRVSVAGVPARILYISDFDPAGVNMPFSVARKIEFDQTREEFDALDVRLQPIVLTATQVEQYSLPRVPIKDSDKRKANWIEIYGRGAVELDALEALYPGELARIVEDAISNYRDSSLQERAQAVKARFQDHLDARTRAVMARHTEELDAIETDYAELRERHEATRAAFRELVQPFQEQLDAYESALEDVSERASRLYSVLVEELEHEAIDTAGYDLPLPQLSRSAPALYDSRRSYLEQLDAYHEARTNGR